MNSLYESLKKTEKKIMLGGLVDSDDIERLKSEFKKVKSEEKWLVHLIKASEKIDQSISLKKLMTFIVPIERELSKKVTDTDILVESIDRKKRVKEQKLVVVLDNIRSAFNTGALFRTCDALGVSEVVLTGYTQGFESAQVVKTSMGAQPKTTKVRDLEEAKKYLNDYQLVALETSNKSVNLYDLKWKEKTALVIGNERFGLSEKDLSVCDQITSLPMFGVKNSLNVNAALSACGYEWVRRFS